MSTLHQQLAAKMLERPETNYAGAWGDDGTWVYKHLAGPGGQMLLTWYPDQSFTVYAADGRRGRRDFWVTAEDEGHWLPRGHGREPGAVPAADAAAVLSAAPVLQPDAIYGWSPRPGAAPEAVAYMQHAKNQAAGPLRFCRFTAEGQKASGFTEDPASWWREADAGRLRCLDEDIASGKAVLTAELDGRGYFKLVLNGLDYIADVILPGGPVKKIPWAGDPSAFASVTRRCIEAREEAAQLLAGLRC